MQYLSHNMPCERNTRRGQSNRLKTNLLHFAALLLLALAPRLGGAQAQQSVEVDNKDDFRAALENPNVGTITITKNFTLGRAHVTANGIKYGSVYRVVGKKTIDGKKKTIYRGTYKNTSICIEKGASLTIKDLTFDGRKGPGIEESTTNYASMIALPDVGILNPNEKTWGDLTMIDCIIQNCHSKKTTDDSLRMLKPTGDTLGNGDMWYGTHSNGGAAIAFMPTKDEQIGTATNRIHLENCVFYNNKILNSSDPADIVTEIGGAIVIGGGGAKGGTITGCTIRKNYAQLYGGGIYFTAALLNEGDKNFLFTGSNTIDSCSTIQSGGGMAIQGGYVVIDGDMVITENRSNGTGGGIFVEIPDNSSNPRAAGSLIFNSTAYVDISYNTAATGNGGGIYMGAWGGNSLNGNPPLAHPEQANKLTVRANKPIMDIHDNTAAYGGGISVGLLSPTEQNQNKYWAADILFESDSNAVDASSSIYIYDNNATHGVKPMGGGIFVRQNPHNSNNSNEHSTRFTKCIVTNNYAHNTSTGTGQGGGVALFNTCHAQFNECRIYDNHTTKNDGLGGGVYVEEATSSSKNLFNNCLIYENGKLDTIANNQVYTQKGGGAYVNGPATFKGCNIYDNYASNEGGGLFMTHQLAVLDGSQVHENNSSEGGGIHIQNGDIVGQSGPNKIYENTASKGGGIYYIDGRIRKASHANYVYDNTAAQNGGGVFVHPQSNTAKTISHLFVGTDDASATNKGNRAENGGGIYVKCETTSPSITFEACSIVHNKLQSNGNTISRGGGVFMSDNNDSGAYSYTVNLTGGTIIDDNKALDGGGVYIDQQGHTLTLKLIQTTLSKNEATSNGGGIYNNKGIVLCDANGSFTFDDNKALDGSGGGIYNFDGTLTLQGTDGGQIFKNNKANNNMGGGMYLGGSSTDGKTILLKNCDVGAINKANGNEAKHGGGIYFNYGYLTLDNTRVSYNKSTNNGGGIFQNCENALTLQGNTKFLENVAGLGGGGLHNATDKTTNITSATFEDNEARSTGGGINNNDGTINITSATFHHNIADKDGGGIYNGGTTSIASATFEINEAKNGGGLYNAYEKTTSITSATFEENTANNNGGGIYNIGTVEGEDSQVLFDINKAPTGNGGGIYNIGTLNLDATGESKPTKTFKGNTAKNGGGIHNDKMVENRAVVPFPPFKVRWQVGSTAQDTLDGTNGYEGRVRVYYAYRTASSPYAANGLDSVVLCYDDNEGGPLGNYAYLRKSTNNALTTIYMIAVYTPSTEEAPDYGNPSTGKKYLRFFSEQFYGNSGVSGTISSTTAPSITYPAGTSDDLKFVLETGSYYGRNTGTPLASTSISIPTPEVIEMGGTANLSNCVIGGSATNANKATNGHGGGIYIEKGSTVTMTVKNEVTHNTATGHGGGVYKGGTLKVKDMVTVTDNTAGTAKGEGATEGEEAAEEATEEAAEP